MSPKRNLDELSVWFGRQGVAPVGGGFVMRRRVDHHEAGRSCDTLGLLLAVLVTAAGASDTAAGTRLPSRIAAAHPRVRDASNAYPDYYVNSAVPANRRIQVEIWDNANHRFNSAFKDGNSCARGRHPVGGSWCVSNWDPADYGSRVSVHAYFRLYSGNRQVNDTSTNSPSITVSYTGMAHC
ncbi:hypothetical protein [Streptomyces sp. WAC 06783]|uniref:hypothetical protein n=1 Tax=Streptomyces sp. WAC 06783 TaxID=2203211 RepID=UPI001C8BB0D3